MSLTPRKKGPHASANPRLGVSHNHAPKMERRLAAELGGRAVKGSGAGREKGDVRVKGLLRVEAKCTKRDSFSITGPMLDKIEAAAIGAGEVPAVVVEFVDKAGKPVRSVAVMPMWAFEELTARGASQEPQG